MIVIITTVLDLPSEAGEGVSVKCCAQECGDTNDRERLAASICRTKQLEAKRAIEEADGKPTLPCYHQHMRFEQATMGFVFVSCPDCKASWKVPRPS